MGRKSRGHGIDFNNKAPDSPNKESTVSTEDVHGRRAYHLTEIVNQQAFNNILIKTGITNNILCKLQLISLFRSVNYSQQLSQIVSY